MWRPPRCSGSTCRRRSEIPHWPREPTAGIPRLRLRPGPPRSTHRESLVRTAPPRCPHGRRDPHQEHRTRTTLAALRQVLRRMRLMRRRMQRCARRLRARDRRAQILSSRGRRRRNRRRQSRRRRSRSSSIPSRRTRNTNPKAAIDSDGDGRGIATGERAGNHAGSLGPADPGSGQERCCYGAAPAARTTGKSTKLAFDPPSNILMVAFL
jgi:hypothetical protein